MIRWVRETLGQICVKGGRRIQTGPFGSQLHEFDYRPEGIPVVMPADILDGKIATTRIARVPESHIERLRRHKLAKGDIVYGRRGDIGRQALVRDENTGWLCGTGCLKISLGNSHLNSAFLHYYLSTKAVIGWIEGQSIGATMPNLNTDILKRVPVFYPADQTTQRKIAAILSSYDDLIENNRRRIALLENMAEEIYREWFVRMRFPGHEQAKFEKGLPVDWEKTSLGQVIELCYGKALKDKDRIPGQISVYGSGGMVGKHNKALVEGPGIIVGRKGNVGSIHWSDGAFFPIDTVYYVKSAISLNFLFFVLQSMNFINNDAAVPGLNRNQAYSNNLLMPASHLIKEFSCKVKKIFDLKEILTKQNSVLEGTRGVLLPRLISGKLNIENLNIQYPLSILSQAEVEKSQAAHA